MSSNLIKPALFVGGVAVGVGVGYLLTKAHFQTKADEEVAATKAYLERKFESEVDKERADIAENTRIAQEVFETHVKREGYVPGPDVFDEAPHWETREPKIPIIKSTIPDDEPTSSYGYEPPLSNDNVMEWPRDPEEPYVITFEEFQTENPQWDKLSITYYEYDNTLVDEREEQIDDIEGCIGVNNLLHFGKGTTDPDMLYIRHEKREADIEVTRDERGYVEAVMGIKPTPTEKPAPKVKLKNRTNG